MAALWFADSVLMRPSLQLFCANCIDNYSPPSSRFHGVDGAFFGTTFPHLLFQTYRELAPSPIAPVGTNFSSLNIQTSLSKAANGGARGASVESSTAADAQASTSLNAEKKQQDSSTTSTKSVAPLTAPTLQQSLLGQRVPQARLYTPRIYGFRVSEQAKSGPRMRWMRMRPESFEELDQGIVSTAVEKTERGAATSTGEAEVPEDVTMSPSAPGVTADGRSMATGRPIAGRATSTATTTPGVGAA
jgi:casein kinase II subunit beta